MARTLALTKVGLLVKVVIDSTNSIYCDRQNASFTYVVDGTAGDSVQFAIKSINGSVPITGLTVNSVAITNESTFSSNIATVFG